MSVLNDMPGLINGALGAIAEDITLTQSDGLVADGQGGWTQGTTTDYAGKGFIEDYTDKERLEGGVPETDRKILLLADSVNTEPSPQDRITVRGQTYQVIMGKTDPAQAVYVLQVR